MDITPQFISDLEFFGTIGLPYKMEAGHNENGHSTVVLILYKSDGGIVYLSGVGPDFPIAFERTLKNYRKFNEK